MRHWWILLLPGLAGSLPAAEQTRAFTENERRHLVQRLGEAGLEQESIAALRLEERLLYPRALEMNLHHRDASKFYESFRTEKVRRQLADFLVEYGTLLAEAEQREGVPPEIIGAILMIESRLGKNRGKWPVTDLLLSLQLMALPEVVEANVSRAVEKAAERGETLSEEEARRKVARRAERRGNWSRSELLSLLRQFDSAEWHSLRGSWAGALGNCQFIPTSRENYAVDGDGDGRIDLAGMPDAIHSVAHYLARHGWGRKPQAKVIRSYNHSDAYVEAVLELAQAVKS